MVGKRFIKLVLVDCLLAEWDSWVAYNYLMSTIKRKIIKSLIYNIINVYHKKRNTVISTIML